MIRAADLPAAVLSSPECCHGDNMAPRRILPGSTYLITRRTVQRTFLLRPSPELNQAFLYCLGYAAERFGIDVHAFCAMSNHIHLIITDRGGTLPRFMHWLNLFLAKCVNVLLERWESVWTAGSYSAVVLLGEETILEKIVYTLVNPVSAGLVRFGAQWPGQRTRPQDIGTRVLTTERPEFYFGEEMPEDAQLRLVRPPCLAELDDTALAEHIAERVSEEEARLQKEFDHKGRKFLGAKAVRETSPSASPTTEEPRRNLRPRVACRDKWNRIAWLKEIKVFLEEYREALEQFSVGVRDVIFPAGTYLMRVRFAVACHDPPD